MRKYYMAARLLARVAGKNRVEGHQHAVRRGIFVNGHRGTSDD